MPLEFEVHQFQTIKIGIHIAQAVFIFVSWAIEIAVFKAKNSKVEGRNGWYFGLCFLTIIPLIYLTMTPRFPRTLRFANPYAMASVDGLFCLLWLSAFAAQASYNSSGDCGDGCGLSKAVVGLGVFIWLLFALTTFLSLYAVFYYKREGYLPGASRAPMGGAQTFDDPDKDAFSTAPHGDEYVAVHDSDEHEFHEQPVHQPVHDSYDSPPTYGGSGGYVPPSVGEDTSYGGSGGYVPPRVEEDTGYTGAYSGAQAPVVGDNGRVQFPTGRYDNV